ncbi:hypothetical protein FB45DRAFT_1108985 [Roridomyces roridus]|uniref:Uncharacterized protein n=1 Tax=Roridomyces roridus TaxID=1738132 RepID=A0AAD7FE38_9AGAR|nr:hypothetical protein FB45DRAFT_1108985 [Roridomyces roridus]
MLSYSLSLILSTLFLVVNADCGDNGGALLAWGSQESADASGTNPSIILGFNNAGPFDAAGNPILSIIAVDAGYSSDYYAFNGWTCGQANPNSYPQTTYGPLICTSSLYGDVQTCLTISALNATNATISLQTCVDISTPPVPTQTFEWIGTNYITYGWAFLGAQGPLPLSPSISTDYVPSIVGSGVGAYVSMDYVPGGLPPSTGKEIELILELSDE